MKGFANRRPEPPDPPGQSGQELKARMMSEFAPRLFASDRAIIRIGEGLIDQTLPRAQWTHEAHLAACAWIVRDRPDLCPEKDLPGIIAAYNVSVGGVNSDTEGYHETITQTYIRGVRLHLADRPQGESLSECVNALLLGRHGRRDWPLQFYSRERLFSAEARRQFVPPDLPSE